MVFYLSLTKIYFPCTLNVHNNIFCLSEQYLKCMKVDTANEVLKAKSAEAATQALSPEKLDKLNEVM